MTACGSSQNWQEDSLFITVGGTVAGFSGGTLALWNNGGDRLAIGGVTSCSDTRNDRNISYLITNLSRYPNVVASSVGNETSFFSTYSPLPCLESHIRTIRSQVTQPVTTDDDWTFYVDKSAANGDERVEVPPDTILPLIDFAAIHLYPFSYPVWDWQQTGW